MLNGSARDYKAVVIIVLDLVKGFVECEKMLFGNVFRFVSSRMNKLKLNLQGRVSEKARKLSFRFYLLRHKVEKKNFKRSYVLRLRSILTAYADFMEQESGELTARYYLLRLSNANSGIRLDPTHYIKRVMVDCFEAAQKNGEYFSARSPEWAADFCYRHFRGVVVDWLLAGYSYPLREKMLEDYDTFVEFFNISQQLKNA